MFDRFQRGLDRNPKMPRSVNHSDSCTINLAEEHSNFLLNASKEKLPCPKLGTRGRRSCSHIITSIYKSYGTFSTSKTYRITSISKTYKTTSICRTYRTTWIQNKLCIHSLKNNFYIQNLYHRLMEPLGCRTTSISNFL